MGTLKGQNFRILVFDSTASKFRVIGMATGCTVNLTNNVEDSSHKDVVGLAAMPVTTSKSWNVSVDSLSTADCAALLTAIKAMQPVKLLWDETSTTDNQTAQAAAIQRVGEAYLSDLSLTFNDRENSAKSLQFSGTGPLERDSTVPTEVIEIANTFTKGQFVRLFLSNDNTAAPTAPIAAAKQLQLHVSVSLEDATTKDTEGEWTIQEPTAISYDITSNALMRSGETIISQVTGKDVAAIEALYEAGTPVKWKIANVSGANNRTASSTIVSGSVILTQLTLNGPNRQNADYTATLNGYGNYEVAA